jgi:type II secretory pathway pseudopilin PulG
MSAGLALIGEVWHTSNVREKEAELLQVGNEYRRAIERYYLSGPQRQYPKNLSDLIKDPRMPGTVRYLRRLYPDPITGRDEWGLVKSADGGLAGVYSLSENPPLKVSGFALRDAAFEGKNKYSEWQFAFAPVVAAKPK